MPSTAVAVREALEPAEVGELYQQFYPLIFKTAAKVVGYDQAEDIAQDFCVHLLTRGLGSDVIPRMLPGLIRYRAWEVAVQSQRRQHGDPLPLFDPTAPARLTDVQPWRPGSPETLTYRAELRARLVAAFLSLPPQMRTAARLRFLHEQMYEDLEVSLGVKHARVGTLMCTARLRLRQALADIYTSTGHTARNWKPQGNRKQRLRSRRR